MYAYNQLNKKGNIDLKHRYTILLLINDKFITLNYNQNDLYHSME